MLTEILNIRRLERPQQIGRFCQFVGLASILGPTLGAVISVTTHMSPTNPVLDPLPGYNPSVLALRHPVWAALVSVPVGVILVSIGTGFVAFRPWALVAMQRVCWAGVAVCLFIGGAWLVSIAGHGNPMIKLFGVATGAFACLAAVFLNHVRRELGKPEHQVKFNATSNR